MIQLFSRRKTLIGGVVEAELIASYPLADDSDEIIGTTSGIDGVDIGVIYSGSDVDFSSGDKITVPDNDIFSFTDGVNDTPFTIEFEFNPTSLSAFNFIVNKYASAVSGREWAVYYRGDTNLLIFVTYDNVSGGTLTCTVSVTLSTGTNYKIKATSDGNKGLKLFVDDVDNSSTVESGTYNKFTATNNVVAVGYTVINATFGIIGKLKNLKFYDFEKLT